MDIEALRKRLKDKAGGKAGMILIHNGIVRASSRDGSPCSRIDVKVDYERLTEIIDATEKMPGVIAVDVEIAEGVLNVGDDVMLLGIAGDFRENTISALAYALDRIKKEVATKTEFS